jgi:L-ectoine synthase
MFIRSMEDVIPVQWGNGTSHRLLVAADEMGFALARTLVRAGSESKLEYRRHLEACYCVSGSGTVEDTAGNVMKLKPGVLYALNNHDPHYLRASDDEDLELISVFCPAIRGDEKHVLSDSGFSSY